MLHIAVSNTQEELELNKLRKEDYYARCPRKKCHFSWKTDIGTILDSPICPRCHSEI